MEAWQIEKAIYFYNRIVNIPCSTSLSETELKKVCDTLRAFEEEQEGRKDG